jgi:hypothetical protein
MALTICVTGRDDLTKDKNGRVSGDLTTVISDGPRVLFTTNYSVVQAESTDGAVVKAIVAAKKLLVDLNAVLQAELGKYV